MAITVNKRGKASILSDGGPLTPQPGYVSGKDPGAGIMRGFVRRVKPREVIFFTTQLSLMMDIGTSLNNALVALSIQIKNPAFKGIIQTMIQDIEEGRQLSDAMMRHPRLFDHVYVSMIRAGETGGFLKEILDRIVEMQEKRQALIAQVRSALTYPLLLCLMSFLVVLFVLVGVLPKFMSFFAGKEAILPISTRFLIKASASLQAYWWAYLMGAAALVVFLKLLKESQPGQALIDFFCVNAPLVARLFNTIYTCQLLRSLGHLMESQVPLLEALEVTRSTIKNRYFTNFVDGIMAHVEQGGKFSEPFATYPYIMDTVKQMVATGDEAGNLSHVMLRLAAFYDTEVDLELKTLSSIIEPLGLMIMGLVVGLIVSSVILPMFRLAQAMH